jgi:hypothetical protein
MIGERTTSGLDAVQGWEAIRMGIEADNDCLRSLPQKEARLFFFQPCSRLFQTRECPPPKPSAELTREDQRDASESTVEGATSTQASLEVIADAHG